MLIFLISFRMYMDAKKYNNIKLGVGIGKGIISFIIVFIFAAGGYSSTLVAFLEQFLTNNYLIFFGFVFVISVAGSVISLPVNFYTGYILEHRYHLSNQTIKKWMWEGVKGIFVGTVIGVPILLIFFYVLNTFLQLWWLPSAILMFIISVILAQILPVLILPLFYKLTPFENEEMKEKIHSLAAEAGMKVESIYKFDMSKNTKKANAAFTGLGKTKRILIGDTLLENYSGEEIETIIAHELGHYKLKHIVKNILIGTLFSFATFFLIAALYSISLPWFGFNSITQVAALPLLVLWGILIGIIETPISNAISRKYEYEADRYAVKTTGKSDVFIGALEKLTDQNLGDRKPHPLVEWFFYSHPSIEKRKKNILSISAK